MILTNPLLTETEASRRLGVSVNVIRSLCRKGKIAYFGTRPLLFDENDLIEYQQRKAAAAGVKEAAKRKPEVGSPEYHAKEREKMIHRLRIREIRQRVKLILAQKKTEEQ